MDEHASPTSSECQASQESALAARRSAGAMVCGRCGASFVCGMAAGEAACWCAALPPLPPLLPVPAPPPDAAGAEAGGCYCPDCLTALVAQRGARAPAA